MQISSTFYFCLQTFLRFHVNNLFTHVPFYIGNEAKHIKSLFIEGNAAWVITVQGSPHCLSSYRSHDLKQETALRPEGGTNSVPVPWTCPNIFGMAKKEASCDGGGRYSPQFSCAVLLPTDQITEDPVFRFHCLGWNLKQGARDESFIIIGSSTPIDQDFTFFLISKPNH